MQPFSQGCQAVTAVEIFHRVDHRVALGLGTGELHGFLQHNFWNINRRFHTSKIVEYGILSTQFKLSPPLVQIPKSFFAWTARHWFDLMSPDET